MWVSLLVLTRCVGGGSLLRPAPGRVSRDGLTRSLPRIGRWLTVCNVPGSGPVGGGPLPG